MLSVRSDIADLQQQFRHSGRVLIADLLSESFAAQLLDRAQQWGEWHLVTRIAGQHREFDGEQMHRLPAERIALFNQLVHEEARGGFQYLYERYPLYEKARQQQLNDEVFAQAYTLLRSEPFLQLLREVTGLEQITHTDAQLSRYRAGHFLTMHDDSADSIGRAAAFVLNLTPDWSVDHGGLLQFVDSNGQVERAFTPRFNALAVFRVPAVHSVSMVPPYVDRARYALTGWARSGVEQGLSQAA